MRILFCGGGTAGHVIPAIAMAEILLREKIVDDVAFVGRTGGNENRTIVKEGYKLYTIDISGFTRSLSLKNINAIIKVIKSGRIAKRIIRDYAPDLVIGTGGYVCYPIIRMAQQLGVKNMIHESNVFPGLVTRMLGNKCDRLLLNSEGAKKHLKHTDNAVVIGNPLRTDFSSVAKEEARRRLGIAKGQFFILSFGGSLGADVLNENIIRLMNDYSATKKDVTHIHSSGISRYSDVKTVAPQLCAGMGGCKILPYIDDMPTYLSAADLVISRSGAMTISELSAVGKAAILIPSPNVSENHQYENAKYAADLGGALLIEEKDLSLEALKALIEDVKTHPKTRMTLEEHIRKLSRPETTKLLIKAVKDIF